MKRITIFFVAAWAVPITIALLIVFSAVRERMHRCPVTSEKVVEVVRTDTLIIERPVPVRTRVVDTLLVRVADTIHVHDTAYIALSAERKEYGDSTYRAVISGYRPVLEHIEVYPKTVTITRTITEAARNKRFGVGVHVGYGVTSEGLSPYVGAGLSYNLIQF